MEYNKTITICYASKDNNFTDFECTFYKLLIFSSSKYCKTTTVLVVE